jgi:septal ring factor EnvC (AmiA/AmiB activator)
MIQRYAPKIAIVTLLAVVCPPVALAQHTESASDARERKARLRSIHDEIRRLELEVRELRSREEGILGELERLGAELRLRQAQRDEVSLRLEEVGEAIDERNRRVEELAAAQNERGRYLAFRLREIYKEGPERTLRQFIGGAGVERYWSGLRYATYLSERDGRVLREYRAAQTEIVAERQQLLLREAELRRVDQELIRARQRVAATQRQRTHLLAGIRDDATRREVAIGELQAAATALASLVDSLEPGEIGTNLDVHKFRGLMDWPAEGRVTAGFGTVVHPRFKTRVPHPGLDIEGDFSTSIRSVFDGEVVFAAWMRGYGLTVIVDHGGGVLSVYAHASVLLVEAGDRVVRGQSLGRVGETGSLRGPYLYFELRVEGNPADPVEWLRPRSG